MINYPWIHRIYQRTVNQYNNKYCHHALLIYTSECMDSSILVENLSKWLMCRSPKLDKFCHFCHDCQLMKAMTHPDWYKLESETDKSQIGVESVRRVTDRINHSAKLGGAKILWISNAGKLTEAAANALLKTLEEPPENSWFFLGSSKPSDLLATLRSRCTTVHLTPPKEDEALSWLKNRAPKNSEIELRSAIRVSSSSPIAALHLLEPAQWEKRQELFKVLFNTKSIDIFQLLELLDSEDAPLKISWLISMLIDTMKYKCGVKHQLTNMDCQDKILLASRIFSVSALDINIQGWIQCRDQLIYTSSINRELLLINQILDYIEQR